MSRIRSAVAVHSSPITPPPQHRPCSRLLSRVLAGAALLCASTGVSRAVTAQVSRPTIVDWTTEQGLPSNIVLGIQQTDDGYLWLASYQGLVRFDGVVFRTFIEQDIPGLARASFWSVERDSVGRLWAATENAGVVRLSKGEWRVFTTRDGLHSDSPTAMTVDGNGALLVGSRSGISRISDDRVESLPPLPTIARNGGSTVSAIAVAQDGTIWIGTVSGGVVRYRDGVYTRLTERDGLGDDRVTAVHAEGNTIWVGAYGRGVTRIRGDSLTRLAARGAAAPLRVNDILRRDDGVILLAADNGLFSLADDAVEGDVAALVTRRDGTGISQAEALQVDAEGNLWIGSRQGGLFRMREASAQAITTADGLPDNLVAAVDGDGSGGIWIATSRGVVHRDAEGQSIFTRASGALRDDITRDVLRDAEGTVWVATNGGLSMLRDGRWQSFTTADGLADDRARALATGADGTLWVGTFNGLSSFQGGRFTNYGHAEGLTDGYVLSVFEDSRGTLWVGTQGAGLFRRTADGRFVLGPKELTNQPVFRATETGDGTLWIGSARGLARLRGDSVRFFTAQDGLPGNTIFQAVENGAGQLWITGPWGIGRVAVSELADVATGRLPKVTVRQFGRDDGMPAHEASSISRSWLGPDGVLRFATPAGVGLLDPRRVRRNELPPPAHLEQVVVDGVPASGVSSLEMDAGSRKLEFHFTAPSFVAPALLRFRYRLEPFDDGWVDGGTQRVAQYTHLSPGRYTFRVQARNEDGVWSDQAAVVNFRLRPYFWQTWWFAALAVTALALLAALAHWMRVKHVAREVREQTLRAMSLRDELTGLYNRRGLLELADQQMRMAERERRGFALVFVDMDGMKRINDTFGHQQGDRAINDAAVQLRTTFRASDIIGRLGGDEFAVIMPEEIGATTESVFAEVDAACSRLERNVDAQNTAANRPYRLALSVGVSRFEPGSPVSIEVLLDSADREMYAQKRVKGNGRSARTAVGPG